MTDRECHYFDYPQPGEPLVGLKRGGANAVDLGIKLLTHGKATHAYWLRGDHKTIIENFYPRVHERPYTSHDANNSDLYRMAGTTPDDWKKLEHWFDAQLKRPTKYSVLDLFRYAVNLPPLPGKEGFCSMFVLHGQRVCLPPCKIWLVRLEYKDYASPRDLSISPLAIKQFKLARQKRRLGWQLSEEATGHWGTV